MKKLMYLLVVVAFASFANAALITVDDFESYADSAALNLAWTTAGNTGTVLSLETEGSNKVMKMWYRDAWPEGWAQAKHILPGVVPNTSGVSWNGCGTISFDYKITDRGVTDGMSLKIFDCWGGQIAYNRFKVGGAVTNGWVNVSLDLNAIKDAGKNYGSVGMIAFAAEGTYVWDDGAGGDLFLDNIQVPEPVTLTLLSLGGLLLRRRK